MKRGKRGSFVILLIFAGMVGMVFLNFSVQAAENILKIGTPNLVSSANLVFDDNLPVFAHLSNPPLTRMNTEGEIVGQTASSFAASPDNTIWTFYLDDNLYWSDGTKVTPEDVKFTIQFMAQNVPWAGWLKSELKDVSISGTNAVVLTFNKPFTRIDRDLASYNILPKHLWEKIGKPQDYTNTGENVGCGPFYIQKVDLDAGVIVFNRNPFWKGKAPWLDRIELHLYNNSDVLSLALEKGEVDTYYKYASSYPYPNIERLKQTGRFDFVEKLNVGLYFLGLNLQRAPLSDLHFRNAIAYAINYEELIKLDALGYARVPNRGFVPESMENFKETEKLSYNVDKAKKMLDEAGYQDSTGNGLREGGDGKDLQLMLLAEPDYARRAELVKEYLGAVGIGVDIKTVDESTWIALKDNYDYDLTVTRTSPWGMMVYASWGTAYFDFRRTGEGVLHIVDDPPFLAMVDGLLSTTDKDALKKLAYAVQDYLALNLPVIPLYWNVIVTPFSKEFTGWKPDPLFGIYNIETFLNLQKTSR